MAEQSLFYASSHLMSPKWVTIITIISETLKPETGAPVPQQMNGQSPRLGWGFVWIHITLFMSIDTQCVKTVYPLPLQQRNKSVAHGDGGRHAPRGVWRFSSLSLHAPGAALLCWDSKSPRELRHSRQYARCHHYPHQTFWLSRVVVSLYRAHSRSPAIAPHTWGMRHIGNEKGCSRQLMRVLIEKLLWKLHHCLLLKSYYLSCISLKSSYFDPHLSISSLWCPKCPLTYLQLSCIYYFFSASPWQSLLNPVWQPQH